MQYLSTIDNYSNYTESQIRTHTNLFHFCSYFSHHVMCCAWQTENHEFILISYNTREILGITYIVEEIKYKIIWVIPKCIRSVQSNFFLLRAFINDDIEHVTSIFIKFLSIKNYSFEELWFLYFIGWYIINNIWQITTSSSMWTIILKQF